MADKVDKGMVFIVNVSSLVAVFVFFRFLNRAQK